MLDGSENVSFENVIIKAKGETADRFIPMGIKLKVQNTPNQVVNSGDVGLFDIPRNISLKDVTFDGVLMSIQGTVENFSTDGLKGYRYSDAQTEFGTHIGGFDGLEYNFPPPHLMYLNSDHLAHDLAI